MLAENFHEGIRHVFLCHLSEENNDPELALKTVSEYLESAGADLIHTIAPGEAVPEGKTYLHALDRLSPSPIFKFNK